MNKRTVAIKMRYVLNEKMIKSPPNLQESIDQEHLNLLSIFHFILGGIHLLISCIPLIHLGLGLTIIFKPEFLNDLDSTLNDFPFEWIGYLFVIIASIFIVVGITLSLATIYSGFCIRKRTKHLFSLITACINCIWIPFGTALGIFSIILLNRPSVKALYQTNSLTKG